ncbi:hypothetical protein PFISCL1PPCAC_28990, partial [Pristionchus fissidentatus]
MAMDCSEPSTIEHTVTPMMASEDIDFSPIKRVHFDPIGQYSYEIEESDQGAGSIGSGHWSMRFIDLNKFLH